MQPIDYKYIGLISNHLPLFTRKRDGSYNFRCILCGDSQTNKRKKRGFLLSMNDRVTYYCHNCHGSMTLQRLIEIVDPVLYEEYVKEKIAEKYSSSKPNIVTKPGDFTKISFPKYLRSNLKHLQKVSSLRPDHPCKKYIDSRKIPSRHHHRIFYCEQYREWVNTIIPEKFDTSKGDVDPRVVIPFVDTDGTLIGVTGRSLLPDAKIRYITIAIDNSRPMIFGMDMVDKSSKIYVTEGPIDSLFLPNAVAMGSSNNLNGLKEFIDDPSKFVLVMDNEPRNKDICKIIEKAIDLGYNVCIWPSNIQQKDINEMVLSGLKPEDIQLTIDCNTFTGLQAKMQLMQWKKC